MERNNLTLQECMQTAYDDIKDRTGTMIDGIFVKDGYHKPILPWIEAEEHF